jgi:hypothetical protein
VTAHGQASWTVVDSRGLPIVEIEQFLHWLRAVGRSQNTIRSYARHLSLFYRWLSARRIARDCLVSTNCATSSVRLPWDCRRCRPGAAAGHRQR